MRFRVTRWFVLLPVLASSTVAFRGVPSAVAAEPEWSTGMNVLAGVAALASLFCTFIAFDLVKSMWLWGDRPVEPGFFLGLVSKMF